MGSNIQIDVSGGGVNLIARMRISSDGEVGLATDWNDGEYSDIIGNVGSGAHTIVFTASLATLKYNVTIIKETPPAITAENKPMITQDANSFKSPASPELSFLQPNKEGNTYAIGSVTISRKKP
jgi:hypothetical protein